jgi:amino acid adenylation domain-containing protein
MKNLPGDLLHSLFERRVREMKGDGSVKMGDIELSFVELNRRANQLAHFLRGEGLGNGNVAAIILDPSPDVILAILAVLKTGAAYLPIEPGFPEERIGFMLADSGSRYILTVREYAVNLPAEKCICLDALSTEKYSTEDPSVVIPPSDLAYIIYTSGTTGKPKGTLIEHRNALSVLCNSRYFFDFQTDDVWTLFHSFSFDFSVWELFGSLFYGKKLVIVPKKTAKNPIAFAGLLKQEQVTILSLTPSAFYNIIDHFTMEGHDGGLQLRYVILGGEAVSPSRFAVWHSIFPTVRVINGYGVTETAIFFSFKEIGEKEISLNSSNIGKPIRTLEKYVMKENGELAKEGEEGELYISGEAVGRGYLNRPDMHNEKFLPDLLQAERSMYRTGDLIRLLPGGEMEYIGRKDSQIKIRGYRIELEEIERNIYSFPGIKSAVVHAFKAGNGEQYLAAYLICDEKGGSLESGGAGRRVFEQGLHQHLSKSLPEYMMLNYIVFLDAMPLTNSGKVDKKQLPIPEISSGQLVKQPQTLTESQMRDVWSEILGLGKEVIGTDASFFELGGHSLLLAKLSSEIYHRFGVELPADELFADPTIERLAVCLQGAVSAKEQEQVPFMGGFVGKDVSESQRNFYFRNKFNPDETFPNSSIAYEVTGSIDPQKLEDAFRHVIRSNESLRTSYLLESGKVLKKVWTTVDFAVDRIGCTEVDIDRQIIALTRPFDLSRAPLIRVFYIELENTRKYLYIDMPHINSDGISLEIIVREAAAFYNGMPETSQKYQFTDFQQHFYAYQHSDQYRNDALFWKNQFSDKPPLLNFKDRQTLTPPGGCQGESVVMTFPPALSRKLQTAAKERSVTRFQLLLSAFFFFLLELTEQRDLTVMIPVHNRSQKGFENIVGLLANSLVLRLQVEEHMSPGSFLQHCKGSLLKSMNHQRYPFEKIYKDHAPQAFFNYHNHKSIHHFGAGALRLHVAVKNKEIMAISLDNFDMGDDIVLRMLSVSGVYGASPLKTLARIYFEKIEWLADGKAELSNNLTLPKESVI